MKTLLAISILGLAAATFQSASPAAARQEQSNLRSNLLLIEWIGIAASPNGKVFGMPNQSDETIARNAAKYGCEQETGRTCQSKNSVTGTAVVAYNFEQICCACVRTSGWRSYLWSDVGY